MMMNKQSFNSFPKIEYCVYDNFYSSQSFSSSWVLSLLRLNVLNGNYINVLFIKVPDSISLRSSWVAYVAIWLIWIKKKEDGDSSR